jgi:hypothetical protein
MIAFFASCDPSLRFHAGEALVPAGLAAIPPLLPLLDSPDWNVRANAARALGFIGDDGSVGPALAARLNDPDFRVRQYALQALGRLDTPAAHDAYVRAHGGIETHGPPVRTLELRHGEARPETSLVALSAVYRETRPVLAGRRGDLKEVKIAEEWRLYLCDVETRWLALIARIPVPPEMRHDFRVNVLGWQGESIVVEMNGAPGHNRYGLAYDGVTRDFLVDTSGRMRQVDRRPKPDYDKNWRDTPQGVRHFLRVHVVADGIGKIVDDGPEVKVFSVSPGSGELSVAPATR